MKVKLLEPIAGYEDVAEYRLVRKGEPFVTQLDGKVEVAIRDSNNCRDLVLTPKQPFPTPWTFHTGWVAMDRDGVWFWYARKPCWEEADDHWDSEGPQMALLTFPWTPPTGIKAEDSLQEVNPQRDA